MTITTAVEKIRERWQTRLAGMIAYCARHGFSAVAGATVVQIRAAGDSRAYRAIEMAARELASVVA